MRQKIVPFPFPVKSLIFWSNTEQDVQIERFNQNRCQLPDFLTGLMCDMICQVAEEAILDVALFTPSTHFWGEKHHTFHTF